MPRHDDDTKTARMISRGKTRKAGDRSAALALQLMKLAPHEIKRLKIEDDLREEIERARAVVSHIARRRAERTLAGELRHHDLLALAEQVAKIHETDSADIQLFHDAEEWRARLIEEGIAALATFPVAPEVRAEDEWPRLIAAARRERETGKPPGAARALFRQVVEALRHERDAMAPGDAADDGAADDGGDDLESED